MKKIILSIYLLVSSIYFISGQDIRTSMMLASNSNYKAYILLIWGQSNSYGAADIDVLGLNDLEVEGILPLSMQQVYEKTYIGSIFGSGDTIENLHYTYNHFYPGQSTTSLQSVGHELKIAKLINDAYPNKDLIIFKVALGGRSLGSNDYFNPNSYTGYCAQAETYWNNIMKPWLNSKYGQGGWLNIGTIWSQGEADAVSETSANQYSTLLPLLITRLRNMVGDNRSPFLCVRLRTDIPVDYPEIVRAAMESVIPVTNNAYLINIDDIPMQYDPNPVADGIHYTMLGQFDVAERVFEILVNNNFLK